MNVEPRLHLTDLTPTERARLADAIDREWSYLADLLRAMLDTWQDQHDIAELHIGELTTWFRRRESKAWARCGNCGEYSRPTAEEVRDWGIAPAWVCWRCRFDNDAQRKRFRGKDVAVPRGEHHEAYHAGYRAGFDGSDVTELPEDDLYAGDETAEYLYRTGYRLGARARVQAVSEAI